jgi:hypothetical protein
VSEVPLDPKDCKDFLARKYVTLATLLLLNWHHCQYNSVLFLDWQFKLHETDRGVSG